MNLTQTAQAALLDGGLPRLISIGGGRLRVKLLRNGTEVTGHGYQRGSITTSTAAAVGLNGVEKNTASVTFTPSGGTIVYDQVEVWNNLLTVRYGQSSLQATATTIAVGFPLTMTIRFNIGTGPMDVANVASLLAALNANGAVELNAGDFTTSGPLSINPATLKGFKLIGKAPISFWPQRIYEGLDFSGFTVIRCNGLSAGQPWLTFTAPDAVNTGPIHLRNILFIRETSGPIIKIEGVPSITVPSNCGLLIKNCGFGVGSGDVHWKDAFTGTTLPTSTGAMVELINLSDAKLLGNSLWGGETQIKADGCDLLKIRDTHGGNCARGIVCDGSTSGIISDYVGENFNISGIDAKTMRVVNASVEVGYTAHVGPIIATGASYSAAAGASSITVTGVDARLWIAPRSVLMTPLGAMYVLTVSAGSFTFAYYDRGCQIPTGGVSWNASQVKRLFGVPYIIRGDESKLGDWRPNINVAIDDLPVAAFFPDRSAIDVSGVVTAQDNTWSGTNRAVLGSWTADADRPQFSKGGHVFYSGAESLRPNHARCYGPVGPRIDPNDGLIASPIIDPTPTSGLV